MNEQHPSTSAVGLEMDELTSRPVGSPSGTTPQPEQRVKAAKQAPETPDDLRTEEAMHLDQ